MTATIENDDGHGPVVLHSLCLGGRHHFLGRIETDRRAVRHRRGRGGSSGLLRAAGKRTADEDYDGKNEKPEPVHGVSSSGFLFFPAPTQNNRVEISPAFSESAVCRRRALPMAGRYRRRSPSPALASSSRRVYRP